MKNTEYIALGLATFFIFALIYYSFSIALAPSVYIAMLFFAILGCVAVYFLTKPKILGLSGGDSETLGLIATIRNNINKANLSFRVCDIKHFTERQFEGVNTLYRAFLYDKNPSGDVLVIWNTKTADIAAMYSCKSYTEDDLFEYFDPFTGKFSYPRRQSQDFIPLGLQKQPEEKGAEEELQDE